MKLKLIRLSSKEDSTLGVLLINGIFFCFTLEDEHRDIKIKGETRIPASIYQVNFLEQDTPLTLKYRKKFDWFTYHINVKNVPNFTGIYFHIGNYEYNTDGCILLGYGASLYADEKDTIQRSTDAFTEFYSLVSIALNNKESVSLEIVDNIK